jgi:Leucine-rich repeat (LRR) protein
MPEEINSAENLDLHWKDEDPDLDSPSEGVFCKDMAEITAHIDKVKDTVKKINLDNQHSLKEIPIVLKECKLLEEIDISHTNITMIPEFLFTLPSLRSLSVCCKDLINFPMDITKAEKLEYLHIRINKDWHLPDVVASLKNLKTLALDLYSDYALPEKLGTLQKLEELIIAIKYENGDVPVLPSSFANHPALKKLSVIDPFYKNIRNFDLEHTGQILSSCKGLESLKLSGFAAGKGHKNVSTLYGLKELELRHLLIEGNIFDSIRSLQKLESLELWGSEFKITSLPDIFGVFTEMRSFSFAGNFVPELPPSFYSMTKLSYLEIDSTGITALDEKIGELKNLEQIHVYNNLLDKLPESIFSLSGLEVLNIEENIFSQQEIASIKQKLGSVNKNGKKIEFMYDGQGNKQYVKRLRSLQNATGAIEDAIYYKHCVNAVSENPFSLKYVNIAKYRDKRYYAQLCNDAVKRKCFALEAVDPKLIEKPYYFYICMEAVKNREAMHTLKLIKDEELTDNECIQICLEAALNNGYANFLECINNSPFYKRISRAAYERVCWVSVLHFPATISKMVNPTDELRKLTQKKK